MGKQVRRKGRWGKRVIRLRISQKGEREEEMGEGEDGKEMEKQVRGKIKMGGREGVGKMEA